MENQQFLSVQEDYRPLDIYFQANGTTGVFLVCGESIEGLALNEYFNRLEQRLGIRVVRFSHFTANPQEKSVLEGVQMLRGAGCNVIAAVGGGSAIDVAKCVRLFSAEGFGGHCPCEPGSALLPFLAVPTTAGSGSESTKFAVIYSGGIKQSICNKKCFPSAVLLDAATLETLPEYQRKSTMMDALCHAIESFWSVHATKGSQSLSRLAIQMILGNMDGYLYNDKAGNAQMLVAANIAGRSINLTETTAGHALSYGLTSLYGIAHGHAAALCVSSVWMHMLDTLKNCPAMEDSREWQALRGIADAMGCKHPQDASEKFAKLVQQLELKAPSAREEDLVELQRCVRSERLKNHPIHLCTGEIDQLYRSILAVM